MRNILKNKSGQSAAIIAQNAVRRGGFTLVELLIVIAIIAILAAILLPVLAHAKLKATEAYCLNNEKQMGAGWLMYADDNRENLPAEYTATGGCVFPGLSQAGGFWGINRSYPPYAAGTQGAGMTNALNGLQFDNLFAAYIQNPQVYHCPGDTRFNLPVGKGFAYDSYAIPENVENVGSQVNKDNVSFSTMAAIKRPTGCAVFVEQADPRGYNEGTFVIAADTQNGKITFEDVFAIYHGDVGTFAFADGHAIGHRWLDKGIITDGLYSVELGSSGDDYNNCAAVTGVSPSQTGPDASFIIQSFESPTDP